MLPLRHLYKNTNHFTQRPSVKHKVNNNIVIIRFNIIPRYFHVYRSSWLMRFLTTPNNLGIAREYRACTESHGCDAWDEGALYQRRACKMTDLSVSTCRYEAQCPVVDTHIC